MKSGWSLQSKYTTLVTYLPRDNQSALIAWWRQRKTHLNHVKHGGEMDRGCVCLCRIFCTQTRRRFALRCLWTFHSRYKAAMSVTSPTARGERRAKKTLWKGGNKCCLVPEKQAPEGRKLNLNKFDHAMIIVRSCDMTKFFSVLVCTHLHGNKHIWKDWLKEYLAYLLEIFSNDRLIIKIIADKCFVNLLWLSGHYLWCTYTLRFHHLYH